MKFKKNGKYLMVVPTLSTSQAKFENGAVLYTMSGNNPDGIRGFNLDGAIVDSRISEDIINTIIRPMLTVNNGWLFKLE